MRAIAMLILCLALPGCLITTQPVFDETNSIAAAESETFMRIVQIWEDEISKDSSPRELVEQGARVVEMDGVVIVEDRSESQPVHYALVQMGRRVAICLVHHADIEKIAAPFDVTLTVDRESLSDKALPTVIVADGSREAMFGFVMEAFREGALVCQSDSDTVRAFN